MPRFSAYQEGDVWRVWDSKMGGPLADTFTNRGAAERRANKLKGWFSKET